MKWKVKADTPNGGSTYLNGEWDNVEVAQRIAEKASIFSHWGGIYYIVNEKYKETRVPTHDLTHLALEGKTVLWR